MLKRQILRKDKDFKAVFSKGKSVGDRFIVLFFLKNGREYDRIAFIASKKVGNAVARNRARRLMKESVRTINFEKQNGYDVIFIARKTINGKKCKDVKKSIESAYKRSKMK